MTASGWASPSSVLGVVFTFTPLAAVCVALRLWTRIAIVRSPGWDDFCVTVAICFTLVDAICQIIKVHYGLGKHASELSSHQKLHIEKVFWVATWNYFLGLGFAKLSIVLQCLRIFGRNTKFKVAATTLGCIVAVFTVWTFFQSIFICWPIAHFWDHRVEGKCLPRLPLWFFNAGFSVATDIAIAVLPIPIVNDLQMRKKEKRVVQFVLCLGFFVCIVSCIRFYGLYAISVTEDPAHDNPQVAILSNVEASVCIIASCVPTLKGLVTRYYPSLFTTEQSQSISRGDSIELGGFKSGASYTVHVERAHRASRLAGRFGSRSGVVEINDGQWNSSRSPLSDQLKQDGPDKNEIRVFTSIEQSRQGDKDESAENLVQAHPYERP